MCNQINIQFDSSSKPEQIYYQNGQDLKLIPGQAQSEQIVQKKKLSSSKANKNYYYRNDRTKPVLSPEAEIVLNQWIISKLIKKIYVRRKDIARKARKLSDCDGFSASKGWVNRFLNRHPEMKLELNRVARINKGKRPGQRYNQVESSSHGDDEESFGDIEKYIAEQNQQKKNRNKNKLKQEDQNDQQQQSGLSDQKWCDPESEQGQENNHQDKNINGHSSHKIKGQNKAKPAQTTSVNTKIQDKSQSQAKQFTNPKKSQKYLYSQTSIQQGSINNGIHQKPLQIELNPKDQKNYFNYGNMRYPYSNDQQQNGIVYQNEFKPEPKQKSYLYGYQYVGKEKQKVRDLYGSTK